MDHSRVDHSLGSSSAPMLHPRTKEVHTLPPESLSSQITLIRSLSQFAKSEACGKNDIPARYSLGLTLWRLRTALPLAPAAQPVTHGGEPRCIGVECGGDGQEWCPQRREAVIPDSWNI